MTTTKQLLLGEYAASEAQTWAPFPQLETALKSLQEPAFQKLSNRKKFKQINSLLLELIQAASTPCFLLPAVLNYIAHIEKAKLLQEPYNFASFEFWLNRFSRLSDQENLAIRAKIVGKAIPREEYQTFFPIGMSKTFAGTHFIAAHASPDIDTTIASFWGFVDAFGAKVAEGVHRWSLPGTFPDSHFTSLFKQLFSPFVFETVARTVPTLTLTALDLVTQKEMIKVHEETLSSSLDETHAGKAIVLVDDEENYKGDWRSSDTDAVRHIVILFTTLIRWFENRIQSTLIATFAKKNISLSDIKSALSPIFDATISSIDPVSDYSDNQKQQLSLYLTKVLGVTAGCSASFFDLWNALDTLCQGRFNQFYTTLQSLYDKELFDTKEQLVEDRPKIFSRLEHITQDLRELISALRLSIDRLSVMIQVKEKVLDFAPQFVTLRSDVDEIKSKIANFEHITVVIPEGNGASWFPVGVIHAQDLRRPILGTCSLRDFSNEQETQMASYLEVISVVDHHKTNLKTSTPPCFIIADAQSSNTLVAECNIGINKRYSHLGILPAALNKEIEQFSQKTDGHDSLKYLANLLELKANSLSTSHFIHPKREFAEYLSCLYAILDDTDLLSKVSARDVRIVTMLLNRMKSIACAKDVEMISLADIPKDSSFAKKAALKILQNEDMYSIYKKIYEYKELEMEADLKACIAGKPSTVFADTKEQNGCCRVGQTKLFRSNFPIFEQHRHELRSIWLKESERVNSAKPTVDFFLHQISTITSADEVHSGHTGGWTHQDEIWLWTPPTSLGRERLANFLNAIYPTAPIQNSDIQVQLPVESFDILQEIFTQNFPKAVVTKSTNPTGLPIAIISFKAGTLNSRKAQISPYLPRYVP